MFGIAPTYIQDLALGLAELNEVHMSPLDGVPSLQLFDCTTQLGVGKLAEDALSLTTSPTKMLNTNVSLNTNP